MTTFSDSSGSRGSTRTFVRWCSALLSVGVGLVILDALSRWILARTTALRPVSA